MANALGIRLAVKAIIFDLDGTLVDSREAYIEAARNAMAVSGLKIVRSNLEIEIPRRLEQDQPIDDLIPNVDVERFKEIYLKAYYQATMEKTKPFLRVERTLKKLSSKAALAVITRRNVTGNEVRKELSKFGLSAYFKKILTSRDTSKPKPSPEAFIKCAEYLNVNIRDCAVVGDSVIDVRAGKFAGARTVAVLTGIFNLEELQSEKPDLILRSVNELPDHLESFPIRKPQNISRDII